MATKSSALPTFVELPVADETRTAIDACMQLYPAYPPGSDPLILDVPVIL
jgi:hypothetical protein